MAAENEHFFMPQQKKCAQGCQQTIKDQLWGASKQLGMRRNINPCSANSGRFFRELV